MRVTSLPFATTRPRRRPLLGSVVSLGGWLFALGAPLAILGLALTQDGPLGWIVIASFPIASYVAAAYGMQLAERGMRMRQRDAISVLDQDKRPPVLFLRSFRDESIRDLTARTGWSSSMGIRRHEELLCGTLQHLGPVIAIGRPGEPTPELGAARLYVDNGNWQTAVRYFFEKSAVVAIVVGPSAGVWWEIKTALEQVDHRRLLFFFPYMEEEATRTSPLHRLTWQRMILTSKKLAQLEQERNGRYLEFRRRVEPVVSRTFPELLGSAQFLDFAENDTPRLIPTARPTRLNDLLQLSLTNAKIGVDYRATLRCFFEKLA